MPEPSEYRTPTPEDEARLLQSVAENLEGGLDVYEGRVDWTAALERLEQQHGVDLGSSMDTPLIRRLQRAGLKARRA